MDNDDYVPTAIRRSRGSLTSRRLRLSPKVAAPPPPPLQSDPKPTNYAPPYDLHRDLWDNASVEDDQHAVDPSTAPRRPGADPPSKQEYHGKARSGAGFVTVEECPRVPSMGSIETLTTEESMATAESGMTGSSASALMSAYSGGLGDMTLGGVVVRYQLCRGVERTFLELPRSETRVPLSTSLRGRREAHFVSQFYRERCLFEVGRMLVQIGCDEVVRKRGAYKLKATVPIETHDMHLTFDVSQLPLANLSAQTVVTVWRSKLDAGLTKREDFNDFFVIFRRLFATLSSGAVVPTFALRMSGRTEFSMT